MRYKKGLFSRGIKEFEELVFQAMKELPRPFRRKMENVEIVIEDRPSPEILDDLKLNSPRELLGLYQGIPLNARPGYYGNCLPDRIVLFKENIEYGARDEEELKMAIKDVLFHEIGHYFGLQEDELEDID
ncbi:MAG: metallopeptidase family protein [Candidatus Bathyarchaeia archaeon]